MPRFKLVPCRLLETKLVPQKDAEPIELDWRELTAKLAPSNSIKALKSLAHVREGAFVGLLDNGKHYPTNFCFMSPNRSGDISFIISRNPSFSSRLIDVYKVEKCDRGSAMIEANSISRAPITMR